MLKKNLCIIFLFLSAHFTKGQYRVTLQTSNYKGGLAYLAYHFGNNFNVEDSALINNGTVVFKKNTKLSPGIYAIVFPGQTKYVDFLVDKEQIISIRSDTADLINKTTVTGSKENLLFQQYQKYIFGKGKQLQTERQAFINSRTKSDSSLHEKNYNRLNKELTDYRENVIKQYPQSMLTVLFKSMKEPVILIPHPQTKQDSLTDFEYYKKHYWDDITFMDDRIIRTPFFLPKVENYFRNILPQSPDSIIKTADYLLLLARSNTEMYKFLLNWLTDEYMYPKYMGLDAVFVHLFENYHSKGISTWLNEKQQNIISNRAYMLMANLIGEKAADLEMVDSSGKPVHLYDINAPYTLVVFWDPTCSHCRVEVPKLDSMYEAKWKNQGMKIYGVLTENEKPKWLQFIKENNLKDWIHVYQKDEIKKSIADANKPGYKQLYDVVQTPTLYLLDKEKHIIAKKLTLQQMDDLLQTKLKKQPLN